MMRRKAEEVIKLEGDRSDGKRHVNVHELIILLFLLYRPETDCENCPRSEIALNR